MPETSSHLPTVMGFVFEGLPGLRNMYLPTTPGLTVLYGLNGAGKTRVLQGIEKAFGGAQDGAQLLVKVPQQQSQPSEWQPRLANDVWTGSAHFSGDIKAELCRAWSPQDLYQESASPDEFYSVEDSTFEQVYGQALAQFVDPLEHEDVDPFLGRLDPGRIGALREELLRQRLVLITPTGSAEMPSWTVSPAAMEDDDYPALSQELRSIRRHELWWDAGGNQDEVLYPDHGEPYNTHAFKMVEQDGPLLGTARGQFENHSASIRLPQLALEPVAFEDEDSDELLRRGVLSSRWGRRHFGALVVADSSRRPQELLEAAEEESGPRSAAPAALLLTEHRANNLYAGVLLDAPELKLRVHPLRRWWAGQPLSWTFGPRDLNLDLMSSAERRWARWAISHALQETDTHSTGEQAAPLTLIDEPERALHRSAEAHMAAQLQAFASEEGRNVIVSTHSPELLNLSDVRLLEVKRDADGVSSVSRFSAENREELEALGLLPSDLLRRQRGFVMVEGEHDEKLLEHWVGQELRSMRLGILNLRGAKNLPPTIESQVLFDFTDAHLFVVLDNLRTSELETVWRRALDLKKTHSDREALDHLLRNISARSGEGKWIREWLSRALTQNREGRVTPFSIEVPDIIDLVDVRHLVPRAASWSDLRAEYEARPPGRQEDFKTWVRRTKGGRFDTDRIVEAAPADPPRIIKEFLHKVRSVLGA